MQTAITFGEFLAQERARSGLSLRQLAELSGVSRSDLSRYELDQRQPTPQALTAIAQALELKAIDLFLLAGIPVPQERPSVEALLRTDFDLPEAAIAEAKRQIGAIVHRYRSN